MTDDNNEIEMRVQRGLNNIYVRQLSKISLVMFVYYAFISVSHYFVLEGEYALWICLSAVLASVVSGTIFMLIRYERITAENSQIAFIPAGLSGLIAVYAHVFFSGELLQLTNAALITFAVAFATLSPLIFAGIFIIGGVFYVLALLYVPGPETLHFAFMFVAISALSILCFTLRYRTLYGSERLLISNRSKAAKLVEASKRIQENIDDVRAAAAEAERANAAKDVFLANTTHELRTPLTGVLGMLDYLSDSKLDEAQRQAVAAAQFSARTLLVVVNDLLDIAKLDAGKLELKPEPFVPADVIAQVVDLLKAKASRKGLELSAHGLRRADMVLMGDPVRIGQIVLNLLDNAIKFTSEGDVNVAVKIRLGGGASLGQSQATLQITVQDSGPGISEEDQKRLFSRFEQLDGSAARSAEGAGLGLSICSGIALQMGGRITVDSQMDMGSTFTFEVVLPVATVKEAEDGQDNRGAGTIAGALSAKAGMPEAEDTPASQGGNVEPIDTGPRILLAEDNKVNQLLVRKIAARFGWALTVVNDGQEAVYSIDDNDPYDLILMDIRMPRMDGVQAVQAIRRMKSDKGRIPVVALTANTGEENEALYREKGMSAIVGKPIDTNMLKQTVDRLLAGGPE